MKPKLTNEMVISKNYDNVQQVLIHIKTKKPVMRGEKIGTLYVIGGSAPHKPSSSGRITVQEIGGTAQYFPSVADCGWVDMEFIRATKNN